VIVRSIFFDEQGIVVEYLDEDPAPFLQTHTLEIPFDVARRHDQLWYDVQEAIETANTLVDSALQARHDLVSSLARRKE